MDMKQALKVAKNIESIVDLHGNSEAEQETFEALLIIRDEMIDVFSKMAKIQKAIGKYNKAYKVASRQIGNIDEIFFNWITGVKE